MLRAVERDLQRYAQAGLIHEQVLARLTAALKEEPVKPAPELISTELVTAEAIEEATPFATPKSPEPRGRLRVQANQYAAGGTRSRRAGLRSKCQSLKTGASLVGDLQGVPRREEHPLGRAGGRAADRLLLDRFGDQLLGASPSGRC